MTTWAKVSLGDICEFKYGKSLAATERSGAGVEVFGSNGVVGYHDQALTAGPTIVVGRKGSLGEVNYSAEPCWPIDTTYFIDSSCTGADLRWLSHRLSGLALTTLNRAAAVPGLNREDAYRLPLLLPPLQDQRRIAHILDSADALRAKRRATLALLDSLAGAVFLEMFGDPVTNQKAFPVSQLADLGTVDRGVSKHRPRNAPELLGGPYPLIQTGEIANSGGYIDSYRATYSQAGLNQSKLWPAGTLCITIAANIAKTGILTFDACFPDSVVGFRSDPATVEYVRIWLSFLQKTLEDNAPESAQKNINLALLRQLPIPVPPIVERERFAERVAALQRLKSSQRKSITKLDKLFASLQHQAFNGEL